MPKKLVPWIRRLGIIALVLYLALGIAIFISKLPKGADIVPLGRETVQVNMVSPLNESAWSLDSYIPLKASVSAKTPIDTVKLFINGELYATQVIPQDQELTEYTAEWNWQPGTTGKFYLIVYATSRQAGAGNSQPLSLTAIPSGGTRQLILALGGETLTDLAETNQISLVSMQKANPDIDPQTEFAPGAEVFIPNPPVAITNTNIIQGIPIDLSLFEGQEKSVTPTETLGELPDFELISADWTPIEEEVSPPPQDFLTIKDKLALFYKSDQESATDTAPDKPVATIGLVTNTKCDVNIKGRGMFGDLSGSGYEYTIPSREDGFYIYRSRDGGPFERIATLPPDLGTTYIGTTDWIKLVDPAQYGFVTYTISAFNGSGETVSEPVSLPLGELGCKNPHALTNPFGPTLVGDELVMPYKKYDMAYFYIQINDSAGVRVPEGNRTFLSGSGGTFNIRNYLETVIDKFPDADLNLKMEIWVWSAGKLKHLGNFQTNFHRSVLLVCSKQGEGSCTSKEGTGVWGTDVNLDSSIPLKDQVYELRWLGSNMSKSKDVKWSLAAEPFTSIGLESSPMVISKYSVFKKPTDGYEGTFTFYPYYSLYPDETKKGKVYDGYPNNDDYRTNYFQDYYPLGTPFTLYSRVLTVSEINGLSRVSNVVTMRYNTSVIPPKTPPLSSPYTSIYTVEILENTYIMPNFPNWNDWGCVEIDADPTSTFPVPSTQCPGKSDPYPEEDCGWNPFCYYQAMFTPMASVWDYAVKIFNDAKAGIVSVIAGVIPGCDKEPYCTAALKAGLDYGIEALTGIPPLPSSDAIVAGQVNQFIDSQLGGIPVGKYICNDECKKITSKLITDQLIKARSIASQTACLDVIAAQKHGQHDNCLDPSIQVHPAKGSMYNPGMVVVKVTRRDDPQANAIQQADSGNYKLFLQATGENSSRKGYWGYNCEYRDNIPQSQLPDPTDPTDLANFDYREFQTDKQEGILYKAQYLNIPWLQPGESVEIPVTLDTISQWMGTEDQLSCVTHVDVRYLFYRGTTHMQAAEYCLSPGSSQEWVPCTNGGSDTWDFANPEVP
jgi:hypothetical protein